MPVVNAKGIYSLTVTNNETGCSSTDDVIVMENTMLPIAIVAPPIELNCTVASVMLDGSNSSVGSSFSYQWTTSNGNIVSGANSLTPTVDEAGNYTLLVTNLINSCTAQIPVNVTRNTDVPNAFASVSGELDCNNPLVTIDGSFSGGINLAYEWFDSDNNSISNGPTITASSPGIYTLVVINQNNNCTDAVSYTHLTLPTNR